MTRNLANSRHGIPRGGLKAAGDRFVSNSPEAFDARPVEAAGRANSQPSTL